jgi:molybdopterin-dependent oxidoreductase alpha subunit
MTRAPRDDPDDRRIKVTPPVEHAAGIPGIAAALKTSVGQMGVARSARTLLRVNQTNGFDCPGCAWPEPGARHLAEFCENGAKAVAEEATTRRITRAFFAEHPVEELATRSDWWLGQQGRLTEPMIKRSGAHHYEAISWDDAFALIGTRLNDLASPDEAIFYTSGRTSNEAAFLYQLLVREYGTNNLPDCSNMCHESSGSALTETIGVGKGTVSLDDIHQADLILVVGQNPGTNHPRMLSALELAKQGGARIVAVNPLPEAGLINFRNPQELGGLFGSGTALADRFCQIRVNGDLAFFQALNRMLLDADADGLPGVEPGSVLDHEFIAERCGGFEAFAESLRDLDWDDVDTATGLDRSEIVAVRDLVVGADRIIVCWAMGLTQHRNSVATIREIVNFLLLRGSFGRPGAGACPVRGHSNVQGDRTMGIYEKPRPELLDALGAEFGFDPPRHHGHDTVDAIRAMRDGTASVFVGMGGNFVRATPDSDVTAAALQRCALTVQISTKLNRSHAVVGDVALILPTLGRPERDTHPTGDQVVTVEDSMSMVHVSQGRLEPASEHLRSEVAIVCGIARATFGSTSTPSSSSSSSSSSTSSTDWSGLEHDYTRIRGHIARVIPGFEDFDRRVREPGGFVLPSPPRDERRFPTPTGVANFTVNRLDVLQVPPGRLLLQTIRSHDQYNTTIYGRNDRYRGIRNGRSIVLVNPDDLAALGFDGGDIVDIVSEWTTADGVAEERRAERFRLVPYPTTVGCAAAYFPEANVLVPLDSQAETSGTPTSKSVIIRFER